MKAGGQEVHELPGRKARKREKIDIGSRDSSLQQLDQARDAMQSVLAQVDSKSAPRVGWSVKEVLAHIAGWDAVSSDSLDAHARGINPEEPWMQDIDLTNARLVAERRDLTYEQTVKDWEHARLELRLIVETMPQEKLGEPFLLPWGHVATPEQVVTILAEHEIEHAEQLREAVVSKRVAQPEDPNGSEAGESAA